MSLAPYFSRNFSTTDDTCLGLVMATTLNSASAPPASTRIDGFLSTFLYHCVSDPFTGTRYSLSLSNTNQTGIETARPDFLPVTVIVISLDLESRSFRASLGVGMCTPSLTIPGAWAVTRLVLVR